MNKCESCHFYAFDDEFGDYVCYAGMDEDEYARLIERGSRECPYWRDGDEYSVVRHDQTEGFASVDRICTWRMLTNRNEKAFPDFFHLTANEYEKIYFSAGKVGYQVEVSPAEISKIIRMDTADLI